MTKAAFALLNARKNGGVVPPDALEAVTDLETAYRVQAEQLVLSGESVSGWKIGATSAAAKQVLGLDTAVFGPVADGTVHADASEVPLQPEQGNFIESEFTVRLAKDLPEREELYTFAEILDAIGSVQASFEVVTCRLQSGLAGAGNLVVADFGVNGGAVLGQPIAREHWENLSDITVGLSVDGEQAAEGSGAGTGWGHVFDAVAWLAAQQSKMARPLKAGDLVMTGTCTGVLPIKPGQILKADFGGLASVRATFT